VSPRGQRGELAHRLGLIWHRQIAPVKSAEALVLLEAVDQDVEQRRILPRCSLAHREKSTSRARRSAWSSVGPIFGSAFGSSSPPPLVALGDPEVDRRFWNRPCEVLDG
jgi:hypothetical protein